MAVVIGCNSNKFLNVQFGRICAGIDSERCGLRGSRIGEASDPGACEISPDFGQSAPDRVFASEGGMWAPTALAAAFGRVEASFFEPQGKSKSHECLVGGVFAAVQQTMKELSDRLVDSVKELGGRGEERGAFGGSTPSTDHVQERRTELLATRETFFVSQKDLLQLQNGFLAERSEWSPVQRGGDMVRWTTSKSFEMRFQVCGKCFLTVQKTSRCFRTISSLYAVSGPHSDLASTRFQWTTSESCEMKFQACGTHSVNQQDLLQLQDELFAWGRRLLVRARPRRHDFVFLVDIDGLNATSKAPGCWKNWRTRSRGRWPMNSRAGCICSEARSSEVEKSSRQPSSS